MGISSDHPCSGLKVTFCDKCRHLALLPEKPGNPSLK
jgi:hypothetical protein